MDSTERTALRVLRRRLVVLLLVVRITGIAADDTLPYTLVVDPPSAEVGETVRVSFVVTGIAPADLSVTAPALPRGLEVIRGPYIRPLLPGEGSVIEYDLRSTEEGIYSVPGFTLSADGAGTTTAGFRINVTGPGGRGVPGADRRGSDGEAVVFRWITESLQVELNRSVPVFLAADREVPEDEIETVRYGRPGLGIATDFPRLKELLSASALGSDFWENFRTSEGGRIDGDKAVSVAAGFLYTPLEAGSVIIPGGTVTLRGGKDVTFAPLELAVVPLPPGAEGAGGIGDFRLDASLSTEGYAVSGTAELKVRISGTGNLPIVRFPRLECNGARCYEGAKQGSVEPSLRGYTGWVERVYQIEPLPGESSRIVLTDFQWFDPRRGRPETAPGQFWELPVTDAAGRGTREAAAGEAGEPAAGQAPGSEGSLDKIPDSFSLRDRRIVGRRFPYEEPVAAVVFLPGLFALAAGLLARRARRGIGIRRSERRSAGVGTRRGTILSAVLLVLLAGAVTGLIGWAGGRGLGKETEVVSGTVPFEVTRAGLPHSGLLLDAALRAEAEGMRAEAIARLIHARRLDPGDPLIRKIAERYEADMGIGLMSPAAVFSRPDLLYLAAAALLLLAGLLLVRGRTGGAWASGGCGAAAAGMFAAALILLARPDAVAGGDASLKRIPEERSGVVRDVAEGTVLKTSARTGAFTLVETETGEEGWIENRHLVEL